jgi:glycosyltransferase involved in cell wall biosynthesis
MEISVVIPTYNRLETLAEVVPTLLAQDLTSPY